MNKNRTKILPKWAQKHISDLEARLHRAELTLPWTKPGMEWFTVMHPDHRDKNAKEKTENFSF